MLRFDQVGYTVNGREILRGLSFDVERGKTLVLLGRSGSGKTTALKMVNAMVLPTSGSVIVEGRATTAWNSIELRRRIGYVIQETGLFPHFTVAQNVAVVPRLLNWPADRVDARVKELLTRVGLSPEEYSSRYPRQLSGGQRQRVGVARALAADPPILLFDEPFGSLDPVTRHEVRREFLTLARDLGKTILFVTHDVREAVLVGDEIALLNQGSIEERLPASAIREGPVDRGPGFPRLFILTPVFCHDEIFVRPGLTSDIIELTFEHLVLVVSAMSIAIAIGVPAGILLTRRVAWRRPVLTLTNVLQTIPSLALFGFLIPLPLIGGIGPSARPSSRWCSTRCCRSCAIPSLGFWAWIRRCANPPVAMGMTAGQMLRQVELPLAARTILAGIRVATVTTIGTATIAAAIGGGGLGVFIFRGVASVDSVQILAGADSRGR